jgi:GT2 family glycosyltransferase/glycosyltransferase involved in cell wall biosynthesis/SAM-dependent methyltransferase
MRRGGAPRLIEWTGERCVPWAPDVQVIYEHYHRYLWAGALVADQRVLDLGSGEGFGAALLADSARSVLGVDIDATTVEHSRRNYTAENLEFRVASATDLRDIPDESIDVVVAFEVIEHIADQGAVLAEVQRVLTPAGVLALSTPDREAYAAARDEANVFHERELTQAELTVLLRERFESLVLFGQRTATGSRIDSLTPGEAREHGALQIERAGDGWREADQPPPIYLIAVASNGPLPEVPPVSTLSDFGLELLRAVERDRDEREVQAQSERAELLARAERERTELIADAERARAELLADAERAAADARAARSDLEAQLAEGLRDLDDARSRITEARDALARVEQSVTWQLFQAGRRRLYGAIGRDSPAGHAVSRTLLFLGRVTNVGAKSEGEVSAPSRYLPVTLPRYSEPRVSIIVPVHSGAELTERCLRAIVRATDHVPYEVIIVDDQADPETRALLEVVEGARILVNETNQGYLRSVNRAAAVAAGLYLVLLNNDTEPQPGWLAALVARTEAADDIGVVSAKLVFPDGRLQEAGGIVWHGGKPWNYGRGHDAGAPEYNYVREVDYGSAAALLVRADLWRDAGGFDERFAPGYFEDADLCFTARELGWRVMYEPQAVVVHVEGGAMGTDTASGGKRHQELNQPKFAAKWSAALQKQPTDACHENAFLASNRRSGPHVLVVDHRVPAPDRDSGSLRMWNMLENLRELGCCVSFMPDDGSPYEPYGRELQARGIQLLYGSPPIGPHLAAMEAGLSLVILSRPYVAARYIHSIREHAPRALLAYDTVDLHHLREERRVRAAGGADYRVAGAFRELELALARAADVTLVVSAEEHSHLAEVIPDVWAEVIPNANTLGTETPAWDVRSGLLFVGGFAHTPNTDAVIHLVEDVMPLVWRDLPDVTLTVVGADAPPSVTALASDGVEVVGWVPDLGPLLRKSLASVAPLRYGAGLKGKVTQSLAAGLPVVSTGIGAEGLDVTHGQELLIGDDPVALAEGIIRLHRDPELWQRLSENGRIVAERSCSPSIQRAALERLLAHSDGAIPAQAAAQSRARMVANQV